ncbi:DnaD domain-containing protein [Streptococcus suis]|uniref:Putative DNA replication protein n=1 Tax=Streptococcus suis TaxID=1307 RepID=A0A0Z8IV72_STRSU|nr:DnaD domain protein [Streptococcus suis]MBY4959021.1 DnaD domain protein [Streptococcus suis]NQG70727.1 DnaD domain protein [Streptococcus suis]CYV42286.1 putative DNA replication protein [Streptococcus suis]
MAQRRMFSKEITTSDHFVDMPQSTQLLYFHLGMEADDEGFIGNARMLSRAYGANSDDLKLLQAKGFIIIFESGVTVVKDWNLNNQIRKDRLKPTIYQAEKSLLTLDNTGVYQLDNQMTTKPQPNDNQMTTKCPHRLGKDSIDKDSIGEQQLGAGAGKNIIFEKLKDAFGEMSINGTIVREVEDLLSKHGQELLIHALDETILNGGRSIRYTRSILDRWHGQGLKTVEQVKQSNTSKQKSDDWVPDPNYPPPY